MIKTTQNRYNGIIVEEKHLPDSKADFITEVIQLIKSFKNEKLLWIKIPIEKSEFIPELKKFNFEFHHCNDNILVLVKKLNKDSFIPTSKNYIVGVGAIVFNDGKLLVVKDKFYKGYKLPGGHIDKKESIKDALKREVCEETGIKIEFESIVNLGHFINGQFGASNLYIVCTAKAITDEINVLDSSEIREAKWIDIDTFLKDKEVNAYNKSVVKAAMENIDLKLTEQRIKLKLAGSEVFF
jgi:8-oxo-dGTP diphosphatase